MQNPPKYEAYQSHLEANHTFASDFQKTESLLKKAYQIDSDFYAPLLKMIPLYRNNGKRALADSLIAFIHAKNPS